MRYWNVFEMAGREGRELAHCRGGRTGATAARAVLALLLALLVARPAAAVCWGKPGALGIAAASESLPEVGLQAMGAEAMTTAAAVGNENGYIL